MHLDKIDDSVELPPEEYEEKKVQTTFYRDHTKTILSKNDSPDIGFTYSINPYRGCEHGCIYCYARPTHEYLGFSSGIDFETKIMVKPDAPELLEEAFSKKSYVPQTIAFSGNTDCYQPAERKFQITRKCLEVFLKFRNPIAMITKNALIQRDIDILSEMAKLHLVKVVISITSLDKELIRQMEPRTSTPKRRLETVKALAENGINVGVNVAPIVPAINDNEIPAILKAASEHGAYTAGFVIMRLPYQNKDLFLEWVERTFPGRANKIINRIKSLRDGMLYKSEWGTRMTGEGKWADTVHDIFNINCQKYGLNKTSPYRLTTEHFRRIKKDQFGLF
jgi:DNA repair photolyase